MRLNPHHYSLRCPAVASITYEKYYLPCQKIPSSDIRICIGFLASRVWKLCSQLPKFSFKDCFLLISSHVAVDFIFTSSPISFFWPITVNWSDGYSGLRDVVSLILFGNYQNAHIIIGSALIIILHRTLLGSWLLKPARKLKSMFRL